MIRPLKTTPHNPAAEARDWFVRLRDDDLADADITDWESWIRSDPANQKAYDKVSTLWAAIGETSLKRPSAQALATDGYTGAVSVPAWNRRGSRLRLVTAASFVAVIGLLSAVGWTIWDRTGVERPQFFQTALAQHEAAVLSDGSQVQLAAMTAMEVKFVRHQRHIRLQHGEALFQVAHNRARPFIVETRQARITAIGTAFDVHLLSNQVAIDVTEGVVNIQLADPASSPVEVKAGRRFVTDGKRIELAALDTGLGGAPAWIGGRLEYRSQPLSAVLEDVNRYAHTPIVLGDAAAGRLDFTGTVQLDALDMWAVALPRVFPLGVERRDGQIVLTTRKITGPLSQ